MSEKTQDGIDGNSKNGNLKKGRDKEDDNKKSKSTKPPWYAWGIKVFVLSFVLSMAFSFITESVISESHLIISIIVLLVLLVFNLVCDILATAVTSCTIEPFLAMASRKIKGAKKAVSMSRNAHIIASICGDVIGDICGIISGAVGASLALNFILNASDTKAVIVTTVISGIIAALTVGGKGLGKALAIRHDQKIVFFFARIFSLFSKEK